MKLCIKGWISVEVDGVDREQALLDRMVTNIDSYGLQKTVSLLDHLIKEEFQYKFEWAGASSDQDPKLINVVIGEHIIPAGCCAYHMKPSELDEITSWIFNYQLGK